MEWTQQDDRRFNIAVQHEQTMMEWRWLGRLFRHVLLSHDRRPVDDLLIILAVNARAYYAVSVSFLSFASKPLHDAEVLDKLTIGSCVKVRLREGIQDWVA